MDKAEELKRCCTSVNAGTRRQTKSIVLWLVFAMGALLVMHPYLRLATIHKRALLLLAKSEKTGFQYSSFSALVR